MFDCVELVTQQLRKFRATFASVVVASSCAKGRCLTENWSFYTIAIAVCITVASLVAPVLRHPRPRAGNAGTNVKVLTSKREVFFYVSKYMGKMKKDEGCACPGRFWGVVNPKNIPTGERKRIDCTGKQATQLMRFMRRYVHAVTKRKYRFNRWSMNCMCNADFWLERLPKLLGALAPPQSA